MSKPKLPKVWVEFEEEEDGSNTPVSVRFYRTPGAVKYAPVQKPKVCVWTKGKVGCQTGTYAEKHKSIIYCPYCGGKIKVTK